MLRLSWAMRGSNLLFNPAYINTFRSLKFKGLEFVSVTTNIFKSYAVNLRTSIYKCK